MATGWRTVRVFISSTFRDMHAERDVLVRLTFPDLRHRLKPYRIHLDDIDLRWGVTCEQAENDLALDVCLRQIDACRPFFVGLLGERYGWVPRRIPQAAILDFPWLPEHAGASITELEIWHGVLNNTATQNRAFFYLRDPSALNGVPPVVRDTVFVDTDPAAVRKLAALKERIRQSACSVVDGYPAAWESDLYDQPTRSHGRLGELQEFEARVGNDLWEAIRQEYDLNDAPPVTQAYAAVEDADEHERFMEARLRVFVGRQKVEADLHAYAAGPPAGPCFLAGPSGSGKSAALARFATDYRLDHPEALVVAHFVGAGQRSTALCDLLRRLADHLHRHAGLNPLERFPDDPDELVQLFRLAAAECKDRRVLVIVDALDQLEPEDRPHDLHWLPGADQWPQGLRLVASYVPDTEAGKALRAAAGGCPHVEIGVPQLTDAERKDIIRVVPSLSAKTLDDQQVERLLANPATANPLYLLVALEELRGFGVYEQVNERIDRFPAGADAVRAIFDQVLERLEAEHDPTTVRSATTLLATARRGLSDRELYELVGGVPEFGTPLYASVAHRAQHEGIGDLFMVLRQLRPYLFVRREVTAIYHPALTEAIRARYLGTTTALDAARRRLADYFGAIDLLKSHTDAALLRYFPTLDAFHAADKDEIVRRTRERLYIDLKLYIPRKIDELPWHLMILGDWQRLYDLLADQWFLLFAWQVDSRQVHRYWAQVEQQSALRMVEAYRQFIEAPDRFADVLQVLPFLLSHNGQDVEALRLWDALIVRLRQDRAEHAMLAEAMNNRAQTLHSLGRLDEALAGHQDAARLYQKAGARAPAGSWLTAMINRAQALFQSGRQEEAIQLFEEHERLCRELGERRSLAAGLVAQGLVRRRRDDPDGAMARFREAERIGRDLDDSDALTAAMHNQALLLADRGDFAAALALLDEVEKVAQRTGDRSILATVQHNRERFQKDLSLHGGRTTTVSARLEWHETAQRSQRLEADGQFEEALKALRKGERSCRRGNNWPELATCLLNQAWLLAGPLARPTDAKPLMEEVRQLVSAQQMVDLEPRLSQMERFVRSALALDQLPVPKRTLRARVAMFWRNLTGGK